MRTGGDGSSQAPERPRHSRRYRELLRRLFASCPRPGPRKQLTTATSSKALETLKQAIDAGYGDKVNLETEPDLDAIRDRAEFKALLNKLPEP